MSDATRSLKDRAREELRNYAFVTAYLYVCLGALFLYKSALLQTAGGDLLPHGVALVKALILGKFILLGEAAGLGTRVGGRTLLQSIATKSVLFLLLLLVLTAFEELVVGKVHGRSFAQTVAEFRQHSVLEMLATSLLLLLVLLPLIVVKEFSRALGPDVLSRMFRDSMRGQDE